MWLNSQGIPLGIKDDKIKVPNEITDDMKLSAACIRGIFNTDGTVYRRYGKPHGRHPKHYKNYATIQFSLRNMSVIEFVKNTLETMGFNINKITKDRNSWVCRITSQVDVDRFFREIANNHKYHSNRYKEIRNN